MMWRSLVGIATIATLVAAGCGRGAPAADQGAPKDEGTSNEEPVRESELSIVASDFAFDTGGVTSVPAGRVHFTLTNEGKEPHHASFYLLRPDVTYEGFAEAVARYADPEDPSDFPDEVTELFAEPQAHGVLSLASPGEELTPIDEMDPGTYALLCAIKDPKTGARHYALGMHMAFEVT